MNTSIRTTLALLALCATVRTAPAAETTVDCAIDDTGLKSLKSGGQEWLKSGRPKLTALTLETNGLDDQGHKTYAFDKTTVTEKDAKFDAASKSWTINYDWGSAQWTFNPGPARLDISMTLKNTSTKNIAYFNSTLLGLALPSAPTNWKKGAPRIGSSLDGVATVNAECTGAALKICNVTMEPPFYLGLSKGDEKTPLPGQEFSLVLAGGVFAPASGSYTIEPLGIPRVPAGKSLTLEATLRFAPDAAAAEDSIADLFPKFREAFGTSLDWKDRRPICMLMRAAADKAVPNNPRGWFGDKKLDIKDKDAFKAAALADAKRCVQAIKDCDGQGCIFWDPEGEENPHPITYIGDPHLVKTLAPEFDEVADEYFKMFLDAGLKTGICLRPTQVYFNESSKKWDHGTGSDGGPGRGSHFPELCPKDLPWWDFYPVAERLCDKIAYAKKRWGCTIFYVDTNGLFRKVGADNKFRWFLLNSSMWRAVKEKHPDVLLIPELNSDDYTYHVANWCHTAQYQELRGGGYGTPANIRKLIPGAFSLVCCNDGDFAAHRAELADAVKNGDILMCHGWFSSQRNAEVKALYDEVVRGIKPPAKTEKK